MVPLLAREHTVHVWDLLGFGGSRTAPGATPSIARQARTLAELTEHWGLAEPTLVGHDIGGGIVARAHLVERTLVLWGEQDEWLDPATSDRIAAVIPGAVQETLPGAGHFSPEDDPRGTAKGLLRFFA